MNVEGDASSGDRGDRRPCNDLVTEPVRQQVVELDPDADRSHLTREVKGDGIDRRRFTESDQARSTEHVHIARAQSHGEVCGPHGEGCRA